MSTLAATDFGFVEFTTEELVALGEAQRNFIFASSFICNDIRFYWSLMARSPIDENNEHIKKMQMVRWLWSRRKLASVIYESINTLNGFPHKLKEAKTIIDNGTPIISKELKKSHYYSVSKEIRHLSAHHFSDAELAEGLKNFDPEIMHVQYAHTQVGNSVCTIAEQVFTLPKILNLPDYSLDQFDEWCRTASSNISHYCHKVIAEIISQNFPTKVFEMKELQIENEVENELHRWPLFLDASKAK